MKEVILMKKIMSILISAAMITALTLPAYAEETTVTYIIPDSYTVTIPETITVGQNNNDNNVSITATTNLADGQTLRVTATSGIEDEAGKITLVNVANTTETYLYYGLETKITTSNNIVAEFTGQNTEATDLNRDLKVKGIDPTGIAAGTYTKTIEFTVSMNAAG